MQTNFTQEDFDRSLKELSNSTFEQNSSKILKDYFSDADLRYMTYMKYFPDIHQDIKTNPGKYNEGATAETHDAYFNNLKERYSLYNRPPVDPKIDVAETGGSPFQDFKEFLGFERNPAIAELQQAGFSGYEEYKDPNRNLFIRGYDQDSLINLSYYMPRNKTPRDLKFALNTIYEKTGQKGNAEWAFPNAPEKGIAIKQEGANDNKYVIFDLPQFTPMRDIPDFLQTESIPILGELIAVRFLGGRGTGRQIFKNPTQFPSGMQKVLEWGKTAATYGFGAALGDYLRLQYGKQIGAHDRTQEEMAIESGMSGLLSTAMVGTLDAIARGLPLLKDLFRGEVIPDSVFTDLQESIAKAKRSGEGKKGDGAPVKIDTPRGPVSSELFEITTPLGKLIRSPIDEIGAASEEVTTKELDEAIQKLLPGTRFILSNYSKAQYDRGEAVPNLTLGPAALDKIASEYEVLMLKESTDPKLRRIYSLILQGDEQLQRRFLNSLNKNIGADIDPNMQSNSLEKLFEADAYEQLDNIEKVTANALDAVLKSMGAGDVAEGGLSLFKNVPDPLISTELFNKEQLRLREIRSSYTTPYREKFLQTINDPRYEKLTSGAGKTRGPAAAWANIAKQAEGILKDFDANSAKEDLYQLLGNDGTNTLRKLQGLGVKGEGGFVRPEYTLKELNDAREVLNKYASSQTDNQLSINAARNLERGLEEQMYLTLLEGASLESGIPITSTKQLGQWMEQNEYGIDITQAAIDQRNAIYDAAVLVDIEKTKNPEAFVLNLFDNKAGNVKNTKVETLVKVLTETNAPELTDIQNSALGVFRDYINKPKNGVAPSSIERVNRAKQFINDNKGTLKAFFPEETYGKLNNFKQFEKIIADVEQSQIAINEIENSLNAGYSEIITGILNVSGADRQTGAFLERLNFLKPYLENNPILQAKSASVAKAWLLSNVMERGADGRSYFVPEKLDKILYEGFGPKATGLSFEDVMAPLIGSDGVKYVDNLEKLDLIYKRYNTRTTAVRDIKEAQDLEAQTGFIERLIFPPLTQRGRRVTAIRNMAHLNSGRHLGQLLLSPDKLDKAMKARKRRLNIQSYLRYMTAIGTLNFFDATNDYRNYNPDTKVYSRIKPLEYTGNSVDLILEKVGLGEND